LVPWHKTHFWIPQLSRVTIDLVFVSWTRKAILHVGWSQSQQCRHYGVHSTALKTGLNGNHQHVSDHIRANIIVHGVWSYSLHNVVCRGKHSNDVGEQNHSSFDDDILSVISVIIIGSPTLQTLQCSFRCR
jgi:hypothetical protein